MSGQPTARSLALTAALMVWYFGAPQIAFAQTARGFLMVDLPTQDTFREKIVTIGLGGLRDLLDNRISVGGQADFHGIYSMRIGPFAQANVVNRGPFRLFVLGGYALGENGGTRVGAGVELIPAARRLGLRTVVQRYSNENTPITSIEIGLTWR